MLKICKNKCDQCLFSENRIVSAKRAGQIMREIRKDDSHFYCHKDRSNQTVCKGSVDYHPGQLVRIAYRLGVVEEVELT